MDLKQFYYGKKILVTGAAGTVGRELVAQLILFEPDDLRLMDNNESELFFLMEKFINQKNVVCFLGDVRDESKLDKLSHGIDIIIHLAAFKHVILSEYNPFEVVQTNINGVQNIIKVATSSGVKHVLFTSSDKAVNPTNVMGTSKLMGERLITAGNFYANKASSLLTTTRFGNVLGSRGSVVPIFMRQIRKGGPVTLTNRNMTRFIMTIKEAARIVLKSLVYARGGEVFVTKMPVVRIPDLAEVMIEILAPRYNYRPSDIELVEIGAKPGEKLYEELLSEEEVGRAVELEDMFAIIPAFRSIYQFIEYKYPNIVSSEVNGKYTSSTNVPFDKPTLKQYLIKNRVLEDLEEGLSRG